MTRTRPDPIAREIRGTRLAGSLRARRSAARACAARRSRSSSRRPSSAACSARSATTRSRATMPIGPAFGRGFREMSRRLAQRFPDEAARNEFLSTVHYEATRAGLDPQLVLGVIHHESNFRKYAVSSAGARGFMQVMPFWVRLIGTPRPEPVPPARQPALRLHDPAPLPRHRERRPLPRARPLQRQPRTSRIPERRHGGGATLQAGRVDRRRARRGGGRTSPIARGRAPPPWLHAIAAASRRRLPVRCISDR